MADIKVTFFSTWDVEVGDEITIQHKELERVLKVVSVTQTRKFSQIAETPDWETECELNIIE